MNTILFLKDKRVLMFFLLLFLGVVILVLGCNSNAKDFSIADYLGPSIGQRYIYESSNDQRMELIGFGNARDNAIDVEQIYYYGYKASLPPKVPEKEIMKYRLRIRDDKIIEEYRGKDQIVLKYYDSLIGRILKNRWEIEGIKILPGDKKIPVVTKCKITEKNRKMAFGKDRTILKKECVNVVDSCSKIIIVEYYAEGIGLIERFNYVEDEKGEKGLNSSLKLKQIEKIK